MSAKFGDVMLQGLAKRVELASFVVELIMYINSVALCRASQHFEICFPVHDGIIICTILIALCVWLNFSAVDTFSDVAVKVCTEAPFYCYCVHQTAKVCGM